MPGRVAFLGSPAFAVPSLQALAGAFDVALVLTQPDRRAGRGLHREPTPVRRAAEDLGLPVQIYEPKHRAEIETRLESLGLEALIVVAFGEILRESTWRRARCGAINVHASLLPRWRGVAPIERALLAGDAMTGVCLMQIDAGVDTGPVLARHALPIAADATRLTLAATLAREGADLLLRHLDAFLRGALQPESQDDRLATYAAKIAKEEGHLDWREEPERLERRVRALVGWPGTYTEMGDKILKIHALRLAAGATAEPPGTIVVADPRHGVCVACARGLVQLLEVQLPGRPRMAAAALVQGRQLRVGQRLGPAAAGRAPT